MLNQGKRQYLVKDYQASTDSLSESCAGFTKHYGDLAIECAEPLLMYAQSLLELARIESRVIDNGLEGGTGHYIVDLFLWGNISLICFAF